MCPIGATGEPPPSSDHDLLKLRLQALKAREAARLAEKKITHALIGLKSEFDRFAYAVNSRVKQDYRIIQKVEEARSRGEVNFMPSDLTDVCGFRIITLFENGIMDALAYVVTLIHSSESISPFVNNSISKIRLYTSRPQEDPLSIETKLTEFVNQHDLPYEPFTTTDLYSSVHIITQCQVQMDSESDGATKTPVPVNVEIQIRSVFEEAWSQISQQVRYSYARGARTAENWQNHLLALKTLVDGCTHYAQLIKNHYDQAVKELSGEKATDRAIEDSPADLLQNFLHRIHTVPFKLLEEGYDRLSRAKTATNTLLEREFYLQAGDKFLAAYEESVRHPNPNQPDAVSDFEYRARMEYAWSLYNADSINETYLQKASAIYSQIEKQYPHDATSRYRHALVLSARAAYGDGESLLNECIQILDRGLDRSIPRDHWLHAGVRRSLGFNHWSIARTREKDTEGLALRREDVKKAITITRQGLELCKLPDERVSFINNLLYYGWFERDERGDSQPGSAVELEIGDDEFNQLLQELIAAVGSEKPKDDLKNRPRLDTICRSLVYAGDFPAARDYAARVIALLRSEIIRRSGKEQTDEATKSRLWTQENKLRQYLTPAEYESYAYATIVATVTV
jgi:ppGpp synthetase/RelA/SpoT-type nucleotidyltranferase